MEIDIQNIRMKTLCVCVCVAFDYLFIFISGFRFVVRLCVCVSCFCGQFLFSIFETRNEKKIQKNKMMHWMNCERENDSNWLICPEKRCYNYNDSTAHSIIWLAQFVYIYTPYGYTMRMIINTDDAYTAVEKNNKKTRTKK